MAPVVAERVRGDGHDPGQPRREQEVDAAPRVRRARARTRRTQPCARPRTSSGSWSATRGAMRPSKRAGRATRPGTQPRAKRDLSRGDEADHASPDERERRPAPGAREVAAARGGGRDDRDEETRPDEDRGRLDRQTTRLSRSGSFGATLFDIAGPKRTPGSPGFSACLTSLARRECRPTARRRGRDGGARAPRRDGRHRGTGTAALARSGTARCPARRSCRAPARPRSVR